MILANTRAGLGRGDAQLVVRLVARGSGRAQDDAEAKLVDEGLDALLDDVKTDDDARQKYVDLLELMGPDDPRTAEYRRQLTARLY